MLVSYFLAIIIPLYFNVLLLNKAAFVSLALLNGVCRVLRAQSSYGSSAHAQSYGHYTLDYFQITSSL